MYNIKANENRKFTL